MALALFFIGAGLLACGSILQSGRRALILYGEAASALPPYRGPYYSRHGNEIIPERVRYV